MADPVSLAVAGVSTVIAAAGTYFARQQAAGPQRKKELCQTLAALYRALKDVAHTGQAIGALRSTISVDPYRAELNDLIQLLEEQESNLSRAQEEFNVLEDILDIKAPELGELFVVHLRGKRERIDLIYSAARDAREQIARRVEPGERRRFLNDPGAILDASIRAGRREAGPLEIRSRPDPVSGDDPHFPKLMEAIPELRKFTAGWCGIEDL